MFSIKNIIYKDILDIPALEIQGGKISCLFGPSGCGKTTLLRLLNAMISPDSGTIFFQGEDTDVGNLVDLRRRVVMLPQESVIFPGDVRDNLNMGATFREQPPFPDEALMTILREVHLDDKNLDDHPELFSGGEKQRLALARVLLLQPPVLLLDEPGSALDSVTETIIMDRIAADHQKRSTTCILVTHSLPMAQKYSDLIIHMDAGKISCITTPKDGRGETL